MSYTISNQKPAVLTPGPAIPIHGDHDPLTAVRNALVAPLFDPLGSQPVQIQDTQSNNLDEDQLLDIVLGTMAAAVDPDAEDTMKDLYAQGLIHFDRNSRLVANEVFANQAGAASKLPPPSPSVLYTAGSDVIPSAKALLAGTAPNDQEFFASLAYTYAPDTLGFWFHTAAAFDDFTAWLSPHIQALSNVLPADTTRLMTQLMNVTLDGLTEALVLRRDDSHENYEYSFARTVVHMLTQYAEENAAAAAGQSPPAQPTTGLLPFTVSETFIPRTIVLVNVESHARASAKKVDNEWKLINASLNSPVKVISKKNLSKLTALPRAAARAAARAANAKTNKGAPNTRSAKVAFRKQPPSSKTVLNGVIRALKRMKEVNRSQNIFKKSKTSFLKANRRDPDDFNKPGRIVSTHYLPDIHIYLDCSGSISESNYQQAVLMLIKLAKKLDVNIYFNSFSHILSDETMLKTQGRSVAQIWKAFRRINKVDGGTEFSQIWRYINASKVRKERFSLLVTDFGWAPLPQRQLHPKNLYYAPVSNMDWESITYMAEDFHRSMRHIEPNIAKRMIGMSR